MKAGCQMWRPAFLFFLLFLACLLNIICIFAVAIYKSY